MCPHDPPRSSLWSIRTLAVALVALVAAAAARGEVEVRDEPTRLVLRNERATVVLSKAHKGTVLSLTDNATGQEFMAQQTTPCLFRLTCTDKGAVSGATQTFSSHDADDVTYSVKTSADGAAAILRFKGIAGRKIEALCTASVRASDPLVRWRISISGSEPLVLEEVRFPVVMLSEALGDSDEDDAVVAGFNRGGIFRRPGRWDRGARLTAYQPGTLAAQFACYYDAETGLYTATQDGKGYPKTLEMVRTPDGVELAWGHLSFHELAQPLTLDYDVVSTTFRSEDTSTPTDWRDGAEIYKEWALRQPWCAQTIAEREDLPQWAKRGSALLFCDLRSRWGNAASMTGIAAWIERSWRRHFGPAPAPAVIFFGCEGLAAWASPNHFPLFPSDEAFMRGARALHKVGAQVYLAPSSYQWWLTYGKRPDGGFLWDGRAEFEKTARAHAVIRRDGSPTSRNSPWLEGGDTTNLCHGDPWTREWFTRLAEGLHERGTDIIHLDQIISGHWPAGGIQNVCHSRTHGHPPGHGLWETEAMRDQLVSLREKLPNLLIAGFEEPQELFIQHCGLQFHDGWAPWTSARQPGHEPAPVMEYLYHEFLPLYAHLGGSLERLECVAYSLVNGNVLQYRPALHGLPGEPMLPGGGLEEWNGDDTPVHWQNMKVGMGQIWRYTGVVSRDAKEKHGGAFSLRLEGREDGDVAGRHQIRAPGKQMCVGKTYRLRVWLKSTAAVKGAVAIRVTDSNHKSPDGWTIDIAQATDWTERRIEFSISDGARWVDILLGVKAQAATVWFDDIVLEETTVDGQAKVALWTETPQNRILRQWVPLFSGEGKPYLLMGKMLRPPPLLTGKVTCSLSQTRRVNLTRRVPIHFFDAGGKIFHSAYIQIGQRDVKQWDRRDVTFTVPEGAERCTIFLYLQGKGKLWFDDLELVEAGSDKNLLRNGALEEWEDASGVPSGWQSPASKLAYSVERTNKPQRDEKNMHSGRFALSLVNDGDGDWAEVNCTLPVDAEGLSVGKSYRLSLWLRAQGMGLWRREPRAEIPALFHGAFRAPDGSEAVALINITDQPQAGRLTWGGREIALRLSPWEVRLVPR